MKRLVWSLFLTLIVSVAVLAQDSCDAYLEDVVAIITENCSDLGRNVICYGNDAVTATDFTNTPISEFAAIGNTVDVLDVASLSTAQYTDENTAWGVAVMSLQANLPDTLPGQNVTFVVMGGTTIESSESDNFTAPMQSFRFSTGIGVPSCESIPQSGILVQNPSGTTVQLQINGIDVTFQSTGFIEPNADGSFDVSTIDGEITIDGDEPTVVEEGFTANASDEGASEPEPYDYDDLDDLPVELLPEAVTVPFPVPSNGGWYSSGIAVEAGQRIRMDGSGSVYVWDICDTQKEEAGQPEIDCDSLTFGPNGGDPLTLSGEPLPSDMSLFPFDGSPPHSLIGRIGSTMFWVGERRFLVIPEDGVLEFRINDVDDNNIGAFTVTVTFLEPIGD